MQNSIDLSSKQKTLFAVIVCLIILICGMSTDIYLPSLPFIANYFQVDKSLTQITITSFVLAMGISQLIAGPVSDAWGHKKVIIPAILMQIIAVIIILLSPSIYWIIFSRFIQGVGAAFMIVSARAVNVDIFSGSALKKQFNYTTIVFAIGPIVAPFLGGYLQSYIGWKANFGFILIFLCLLFLATLFFYRETLLIKHTFRLQHLWKNYQIILENKYFLSLALFAGLVWGFAGLFNVIGPFLIQVTLHQSSIVFGRIALLIGLAWFLGNVLNRIIFNIVNDRKISVTLWGILVVTIILLVINRNTFDLLSLTLPVFVIVFFSSIIFSITVAEGLSTFTQLAASANACFFAIVWLIFSLFTYIATLLKIHSLMPFNIVYLLMSLMGLFLYYCFMRGKNN